MKVNMTFFLRMSLKSLHIHVNIDEKNYIYMYKRHLKFRSISKSNFICMTFSSVKNLCDHERYHCDSSYIIHS